MQEAATGIGYGAAALSLWEEFVIRFFQYETQLGSVLPKQDIANHLQQLAQLYQSSSPVLSDIYTLLSCLSPEQLPGEAAQHQAFPLQLRLHHTLIAHCSQSPLHSACTATLLQQ